MGVVTSSAQRSWDRNPHFKEQFCYKQNWEQIMPENAALTFFLSSFRWGSWYNKKNMIRWVEVCPPKGHVQILTSGTQGCDIIWRQDPYRYNQVKMKYTRLLVYFNYLWSLNPIWLVSLWKEGSLDTGTQTHGGQGHIKTEAETGVINLPARSIKDR